MDAEPVLLIDHREREVTECDTFLKDRVCADEYVDVTRLQIGEGLPAELAFPGRSEGRGEYPVRAQRREHVAVLLGEDFRRSHECRLRPALDGVEHGQKGHDRLPDPTSPCNNRSMRAGEAMSLPYLFQCPLLGARQGIGEGRDDLLPE